MVKQPYIVPYTYRMCSIMAVEKVKTTINIETNILKELKLIADNKNTTQTEIINKILKKGIILEKQAEKQEKTKGNNFLKLAAQ